MAHAAPACSRRSPAWWIRVGCVFSLQFSRREQETRWRVATRGALSAASAADASSSAAPFSRFSSPPRLGAGATPRAPRRHVGWFAICFQRGPVARFRRQARRDEVPGVSGQEVFPRSVVFFEHRRYRCVCVCRRAHVRGLERRRSQNTRRESRRSTTRPLRTSGHRLCSPPTSPARCSWACRRWCFAFCPPFPKRTPKSPILSRVPNRGSPPGVASDPGRLPRRSITPHPNPRASETRSRVSNRGESRFVRGVNAPPRRRSRVNTARTRARLSDAGLIRDIRQRFVRTQLHQDVHVVRVLEALLELDDVRVIDAPGMRISVRSSVSRGPSPACSWPPPSPQRIRPCWGPAENTTANPPLPSGRPRTYERVRISPVRASLYVSVTTRGASPPWGGPCSV